MSPRPFLSRLRALALSVLSVFSLAAAPSGAADDLHAPWDALLAAYVAAGSDGLNRFDYAGLAANAEARATLDAYVAALEATPVSGLARDEQFAFWANLYNAVTVRLIVQEQPSRSIRQIKPHPAAIGPWGVDRVSVEGRALSLNAIEHDILRTQWDDPRVHYAVNCASIGCPNLGVRAWRAEGLDADLDAAARAFVNAPRGVLVTASGLEVSRIYKWFREDFGGTDAGVIAHLRLYASPELTAKIDAAPRVVGHHYDWALNATAPFE